MPRGIAAVLYLVITVAAIIAHFYMPSQLIVPGDAAATAGKIMASGSLFRIGAIGSELVVLSSEICCLPALHPVQAGQQNTGADGDSVPAGNDHHPWNNLLNYCFVLLLLSGADYLTVFRPDQFTVWPSISRRTSLWFRDRDRVLYPSCLYPRLPGFRSGFIPRILGVLFLIAAILLSHYDGLLRRFRSSQ